MFDRDSNTKVDDDFLLRVERVVWLLRSDGEVQGPVFIELALVDTYSVGELQLIVTVPLSDPDGISMTLLLAESGIPPPFPLPATGKMLRATRSY